MRVGITGNSGFHPGDTGSNPVGDAILISLIFTRFNISPSITVNILPLSEL